MISVQTVLGQVIKVIEGVDLGSGFQFHTLASKNNDLSDYICLRFFELLEDKK